MENKQQQSKITEMTDDQLNSVTGGTSLSHESDSTIPNYVNDVKCINYQNCISSGKSTSECCKANPSCPRCLH